MIAELSSMLAIRLAATGRTSHSTAVYQYALEITFSTVLSIASIVMTAALLRTLQETLVFLITFFTLRTFCGGYHASSYAKCFASTNVTHFAVLLFSCILKQFHSSWICCLLCAASLLLIWKLAPIRNENHPLSDSQYHHGRTLARALGLLFSGIFLVLVIMRCSLIVLLSVSMTAVAVLMLIPMKGGAELGRSS